MSTESPGELDLAERLSRWPAIWLRDNCRCPDCRDPRNGQKLFGITDLPPRPTVLGVTQGVTADGAAAFVEFEPQHRGVYPLEWLRSVEAGSAGGDARTEQAK